MIDVTIIVNGVPRLVPADLNLAVALWQLDRPIFRRSVTGEPRAPVCMMGVCHECRVTVDGKDGVRACLQPVRDGMRVELVT